jgi:cytochrome c oxidase subunit 2
MDTTKSLLLPPQSSTIAPDVDALWTFLIYLSIFFFTLITGLVIYFAIRYRRRGEATLTTALHDNLKLEVTWIVIPVILIGILFVWGARGFVRMSVVPKDALEIKVTAQKWFWSFTYPEGISTIQELVVPAGKPIKLLMSSQDVIHSFFVPDFRIKRDVLPNRYSITWFEAPRPGEHHLFCAEYCGTEHSKMIGKVRVLGEREYAEWLENSSVSGEGMTLAEYGAKLYVAKTCNTCHSIDGKAGNGPSFLNRFGRTITLDDGATTIMDENYIRESILNPQRKVSAGYEAIMPTFQGLVKDREIDALIAFIKSQKSSEP